MVIQRILYEKWGSKTRGLYLSYGSIAVLVFVALVLVVGVGGFAAHKLTERARHRALSEAAAQREPQRVTQLGMVPSGPLGDAFLSSSSEQEIRVLLAGGHAQQALDYIAKKELAAPGSWKLQLYKASGLISLGRIEEGGKALDLASRLSPTNPEVLLAVASYYMALGRPFTAEKFYFEAIKVDPLNIGTYRGLALMYLQNTMFARAEAVTRRAVEIAPDDVGLRMSLGVSLFRLGQYDEALLQFRKVRLLGGADTIDLHMFLGNCLEHTQNGSAEALAEYASVLKIDPRHVAARNNTSLLLAREGRMDEALEMTGAMLLEGEPDAFVLDTAGWVRVLAGDMAGALPLLSRAEKAEPDHPEILTHLAVLHRRVGRTAQAGQYYDKALEAARGNPIAERLVRDLYGASPERGGEAPAS